MALDRKLTTIIAAAIIGVGILGAGVNIGKGLYEARLFNRVITVKGLAEQDVKSDLAIWDINYREIGNDLIVLNQKLQHDESVVTTFLKGQGFTDQELLRTTLKVEDRLANIYTQSNSQDQNAQRFVVTGGMRVRTDKVDLVQQSVQMTDKLLQQGVALSFDASTLSPNPSYFFMKLDDVRSDMLSNATDSAYRVAKQFSKDLGASLGPVQRASQGVFQIMGRDTSTMSADWSSNGSALGSIDKKVRVVTTIDYRLK